ncbi:DHHA1 domain-containing protein [Sulfurovum sp. zt1-1]|uniref:DHHA1 domain-containing protein n=1 Tax=Sulfurovum zhangzhouensis TaxID=3019067 RepID=A0ABT7QWH2_9BACT|nr:DHHA1 domain-containing protein [Sulfurovum zhangzhouensis]MDM5271188.1 DHHA1 domain-containing protein [Sulfurovum zhangzhouensis]
MQQHIYHLSHIDLDGYGCQYLTTQCFNKIDCFNANYGPEVTARLEEIVKRIEQDKFLHGEDTERLILITDLNLTTKEGSWIEKEAIRIGAKLQLLDHHATGANAAERFAWYLLDTSRSATLITYNWLQQHYGFDSENDLATIVQAINAIDIWVSEDELFEYGKVMLGMISGAKEINRILFPAEDRGFKLSMIQAAKLMIHNTDAPIKLDDELHQIKKSFFLKEKNNTKDNLVAAYVTALLTTEKQRLTITYKNAKGILGYNIGSASIIGNACMVENDDYDFYMDVNFRGNFSLRSNNKLDVSKMAAVIGNGGGHPNAAGGKIEGYKDSFVYAEVREFIQNYINERIQTIIE